MKSAAPLGLFSGHPLDEYEKELKRLNTVPYVEAAEMGKAGRAAVQMAGVVRTVRVRRSKTGKPFAWIEVSDPTGEYEVTAFSETLNAARDMLEPGVLLLISATVEDRDGEARFTVEGLRSLEAAAAKAASSLRISIVSDRALEGLQRRLQTVKPASAKESGQVVIAMRLPETGREVELTLPEPAACTPAMRGALKGVEGVADVELL